MHTFTDAEIRVKAKEIYRKRVLNGMPGDDKHDWFKAIRELIQAETPKNGGVNEPCGSV